DECAERIYGKLRERERCSVCGKPIDSCVCEGDMVFERCVSAFCYDNETSPMIIELKNHCSPDVTFKIACMMRKALREAGIMAKRIDCVTEIPMSEERIAKGRVNFSRELALILSEMLKIEHREPPFVQNESYLPQHSLNFKERAENANSGYSVKEGGKIDGTVLLIDDIVTTGATLKRCSELLIECGAEKVICLTAATTLKK
ncbi:MAG: ComF family protein, partial [Oscillospiraceae bacterium]|nr:ComF family protein [Oscillospiraceae bacterium]